MKWLFLSNSPHHFGGLQTCVKELACAVLDRGENADFYCFQANPYSSLSDEYASQVRFLQPLPVNNYSIRPRHVWQAYRMLIKSNPDVIFFCNSGTPGFLPFMLAARLARVRYLVVNQGTEVELPKLCPPKRYFFGLVPGVGLWRRELVFSAKLALRTAAIITFNNQQQMDSWQIALNLPATKCILWNYPVNLEKFRPDAEIRKNVRHKMGLTDAFVVGCVGGLNRQKSFDVAIRALAQARVSIRNPHLLIAGNGPEREKLASLAKELNVADRVHLLGERSDINELMNGFDIFCLPSTQTNETLGIVILEAMATQIPVVVTDIPGPRRLASDGYSGLIVPPGNAHEMAKAVIQLHDDVNLRQRLVQNSQVVIAECDRSSVLTQVLERLGISNNRVDAAVI